MSYRLCIYPHCPSTGLIRVIFRSREIITAGILVSHNEIFVILIKFIQRSNHLKYCRFCDFRFILLDSIQVQADAPQAPVLPCQVHLTSCKAERRGINGDLDIEITYFSPRDNGINIHSFAVYDKITVFIRLKHYGLLSLLCIRNKLQPAIPADGIMSCHIRLSGK